MIAQRFGPRVPAPGGAGSVSVMGIYRQLGPHSILGLFGRLERLNALAFGKQFPFRGVTGKSIQKEILP